MDESDTLFPDIRTHLVPLRNRAERESKEGEEGDHVHAREESIMTATARGKCESNDVDPRGMTNNMSVALFLPFVCNCVGDIQHSR